MVTSIKLTFNKLIHDTGKAILINLNGSEIWLPKKLCRKLITNKKLGGSVCIPVFFAEKIGLVAEEMPKDIEVIHHVPELITEKEITHDSALFR